MNIKTQYRNINDLQKVVSDTPKLFNVNFLHQGSRHLARGTLYTYPIEISNNTLKQLRERISEEGEVDVNKGMVDVDRYHLVIDKYGNFTSYDPNYDKYNGWHHDLYLTENISANAISSVKRAFNKPQNSATDDKALLPTPTGGRRTKKRNNKRVRKSKSNSRRVRNQKK